MEGPRPIRGAPATPVLRAPMVLPAGTPTAPLPNLLPDQHQKNVRQARTIDEKQIQETKPWTTKYFSSKDA